MSGDMAMWPDGEKGNQDRLDAAINDAARRMTEGAPGVQFKARVLEGIDEGRRPGRAWRAAWVAAPLATVAAILIAVLVFRNAAVRLKPDTTNVLKPDTTSGPEVRLKPDATNAADTTNAAGRLPPSASLAEAFGKGGKPNTTDVARPAASEIGRLAPPRLDLEPLAVTPLAAALVSPAETIHVQQLDTIVPIAVAPLDTEDQIRRFP